MFISAILIRRINRFVAAVLIDKTVTNVYVPNTGRMSELALPGNECLLVPSNGKYRYKMLFIISKDFPVMIDSSFSNSLFADLLQEHLVPGMEGCALIKREPVYKKHRFDFLVSENGTEAYVELKSCTLFHGRVASFPDAVSRRASDHIRALAETGKGRLVILILNDSAGVFVPNYHTDYEFYLALKHNAHALEISALRISYNEELTITSLSPVPVYIPEVTKSGYFLALYNLSDTDYRLHVSAVCDDVFVSSEKYKKQLRLSSHHAAEAVLKIKLMPVISSGPVPGLLAETLRTNGGCLHGISCVSDYRFRYNPADTEWFWDLILGLRFSCIQNETIM